MTNFNYPIVFLLTALSSVTGADEEVAYAQVGQKVTLKIPEKNYGDPRYMYWKWNENELVHYNHLSGWAPPAEKWKNRVSVTNIMLTITNVEEDDFGTLTFSILNVQTHERVKIYTFHLSRITVTMKTPSPLLAGESQTLGCNIETPKSSKTEIYWLNPQGQKMGTTQTVTIQTATSQHSGQWICVIKSNQKESRTSILVTVVELSPPSSPHQFTSKSSLLTIPCSLPSDVTWEQLKTKGLEEVQWQFSPKLPSGDSLGEKEKLFSLSLDNLQWKKEHPREMETVPDVNKGHLSLTRKKGREKNSGVYECSMKFTGDRTLKKTVHVEVMRIIASPRTNLTSGQQLNLTCGFGSAIPSNMQLKLFPPAKSSRSSPLNSDHLSASVSIPAVSTEHSGNWRCELWQGDTQLTSEMITLKIEHKLSVWMLVIICSAAVIVLLLLILAFILYRRKQRRLRLPRHQLCRCKHPQPKGFYKT